MKQSRQKLVERQPKPGIVWSSIKNERHPSISHSTSNLNLNQKKNNVNTEVKRIRKVSLIQEESKVYTNPNDMAQNMAF